MKLKIENLTNKHKGSPCVVALHGPSLNPYLKKIEELQKVGYKRISVNEWYDYFKSKPDYWVVCSTEYDIYNSIVPNHFWDVYNKWPKNVFNKYDVPLLYCDVADLTSAEFVEQNLKCDYLPYDTKHFKNLDCKSILNSFRAHYEKNKNFDFKMYGNNSKMWEPLSLKDTNCHPSWVKFGGAWSRNGKCCHKVDAERRTIQEELQHASGFSEHMGPPITVGFYALAFAVLMGCNPIYVCGMDLDYSKGYATPEATGVKGRINVGAIGHWKKIHCETIENDLRILRESASLLNIDIINLNKDSWFGALPFGDLP